ncbi:PREDICTED: odorant receptor 24a-like [Eufriesea mexicana]|uniref:odorant receptor 24a-like n=1 Tax=Eufriesea mexicana TaxID=516756 RepID=UPI00083BA7B7|nr:PREDICTED: odorant receptor 24a-like [Eufriesea mexicana]
MSEELQIYRNYANFVKRFLIVSGIYPIMRERNIIYRCILFWSILSCSISLCTIGNFCLQNIKDISLLTASFMVFATISNVVIKVCFFSIYQNKLQQVDDVLASLLEEALSEARLKSLAFSCLRIFYRLIYMQTILMAITTIIYLLKPLIIKTLYDKNNTMNVQYPLPLLGTYPWTINSTLIWKLHYLFEVNIGWFIVSVSTGVDSFYGFCIFRMSTMLRLLSFEFETIFSSSGENKGNKGYEANRQRIFQQWVDKHVLLLKCRDIIQEAYGPIILLITVTNAIGICTLIFQLFQISEISISKIVQFVSYFFMKLIQTFLYTWPGDVILTESELLRYKVYCSNWYEDKNISLVRCFLLVIAQRPIILKVCDIMKVSLDLFAQVLNTAMSYYLLLQTIDNDK